MSDIEKYYDKLKDALSKGKNYEDRNHNRSHNAMVMKLMLENSDEINMFCGEMSIFRKGFYDEIRIKHPEEGNLLETLMREALNEFFNKKKSLINIILQRYEVKYLDDLIVDKEIFLKHVKLSHLPELDYEGYRKSVKHVNHFSFTKDRKIARWEMNMDKHEAIVNIGKDKRPTKVPVRIFKILKRSAIPVAKCC